MQSGADPVGRADHRGRLVAAIGGEHVVVIGDRAATGQRQPAETRRGRGMGDLGVQPAPHRIQLAQPLEQRGVLAHPPGRPLVEMVVGVHQTGRDQAVPPVHHDVLRSRAGRPGAHLDDQLVLDHHVTGQVLGAGIVHGGDRRAVDDRSTHGRSPANRSPLIVTFNRMPHGVPSGAPASSHQYTEYSRQPPFA